jgi:hypothetical protein
MRSQSEISFTMKTRLLICILGFPVAAGFAQEVHIHGKNGDLVFRQEASMPETVVSVPASTAQARPAVLDLSVRKQITDFFQAIEKHQIDAAYDTLVNGTKIATHTAEVATLKAKTQQAVVMFGEIVGHEIIAVDNVGTHLSRATCLSVGKEFPLRWRFYYYNSGDGWKLIDIRVDDQLADMFGERAETGQREATELSKP